MIFVVKWKKCQYYKNFKIIYKKNGINTDVYQLQLVSSSDAHPQVIIHTPNYEAHYYITNVTTDSSIAADNMRISTFAAWNRFKVANKCGSTLGKVKVSYFAYVHVGGQNLPVVIKQSQSVRYNLANGNVLNYDPSADQTHGTISVFKNSRDIIPCTFVLSVGLGNWHTAYVKKDSNYYIKLA